MAVKRSKVRFGEKVKDRDERLSMRVPAAIKAELKAAAAKTGVEDLTTYVLKAALARAKGIDVSKLDPDVLG